MSSKFLKNLLGQIMRDETNFRKANEKSKSSRYYLQGRLEILEENFKSSIAINKDAITEIADGDDAESEKIEDMFDKIKELYLTYRSSLLEHLDKTPSISAVSSNLTSEKLMDKRHDLRLPKINLPNFSGSYENWRSFHDIFNSLVHSNSTLTEIEKLHYLKSSISGEAERLLQHLSLDNGNYLKAWTILTNRYDHKRVLVNTQLKIFFGQPVISGEGSETLKQLLDVSTECLHAITNLGVNIHNWDVIVVYIMLQKLPALTQQLWEEKMGSSKELPTFKEFAEFLEARFRTLEAVDQQKPKPIVKTDTQRRPVTKNTFSTRQNHKQQYSCNVCNKGQHSLRNCNRFLSMEVNERFNTVIRLGICENCLAYSHHTQQCPSRVSCYFCSQRHHSLLHKNHDIFRNSQTSHISTHLTPHNTIQSNYTSPYTNSSQQQPTPTQIPHTQVQAHQTSTQHNTHTHNYQNAIVNPNATTFHPTNENRPSMSSSLNNFHMQHNNKSQVLLATAIVKVRAANGQYFNLRALIDPGSEATFITRTAVQLLSLPNKRTSTEISGLGMVSSGTCHTYVNLSFNSLHSAYEGHTKAFVFKSLTGLLPAQQVEFSKWTHLRGLKLADPSYHTPGTVDLLLGSDIYAEILLSEVIKEDKFIAPVAQKTQLGWILLGKTTTNFSHPIRSFVQCFDLDAQLRKFWEIEENPFGTYVSEEDRACEIHFTSHTKRLPSGRYQVCLPFKEGKYPPLGRTYQGALKRFHQLERRFNANPALHVSYKKCMEEYINLGHMTEVTNTYEITSSPYHYIIPHHAVVKECSSTTKLRVVYDAAFKSSSGTSLNDHLMVGPKIQNNVIEIILRWRKHQYTFTADMEKMYRQIRMEKNDTNYQLIFWRDDVQQQVKVYRLETVTFGTAAAPYLAIRVIHKLAEDEENKFPLASSILRYDTYVDDIITGANTIEQALKMREEVEKVLLSAGFRLRKWTSNTEEILQGLSNDDREIDFSLPFEEVNHVKTLGIKWLPICDAFSYQVTPVEEIDDTKRTVLSSIAKLFDPLGWLSPSIVKAKMMMQQLWERGFAWDDLIPSDLQKEWKSFRQELPMIEKLRIPRWIHTTEDDRHLEIHGFSDSSEKAYAAAVYLRLQDKQNKIRMNLIMAKTKVAPLKAITLPRLELCGAVLLAKLLQETVKVMKLETSKVYAWTDSEITLCWIKAPPSRWETFICNRVAEVQKCTNTDDWNHIPSELNPADMASRGVFPSQLLQNELWWNGPSFLHNTWEFNHPTKFQTFETEEGRRATKVHCVMSDENSISKLIQKCSSLTRLTRTVACCKRFIANTRKPRQEREKGPISPLELRAATSLIIHIVQKEMFHEILNGKRGKENGIKALNPKVDEWGVLRVGGRLQNADLNYDQQHPILLKPTHHFTKLVIADAHEKTLHGGVQKMVPYLRQRFWIISIKNAAKQHVHSCNICFRYKSKPMGQLMGNLPAPRVRISRPFTHTGVDYAGPIDIKAWKGRNAKSLKGYFAIFVCMATKAVHIEAVSDLTSQAFLAAFRRFTSRRGLCVAIYSDCGTNFVGANTELQKLLKAAQFDWKACASTLANEGTKWKFNPPATPHFGGLWEAGVKSIKFHLKRIVGTQVLTYEELSTLLTQIEACLNSRPLCPLSEDINDLQALTPSHFLIGEPLLTPPQPEYNIEEHTYLDRWKRVQALLQTFWRRWSTEYLTRLQQRPKWIQTKPQTLKEGDLVLLKDERLPPSKWSLARITSLHYGPDNLVRVVSVKTSNDNKTREFKTPIVKVCPLPSNQTLSQNGLI